MIEWIKIAEDTYQMIVVGGYLIRYDRVYGSTMVFIPQSEMPC